jgi:two-component system, NtrC family, response regulator AtoC
MSASTIVLAEHDVEVSTYLETLLRSEGYQVRVARHGAEVMDYIAEANGDIAAVVLDPMGPGAIETLREVREANPRLPVLILTGVASHEEVAEAIRNGATDFLAKPLTHQELVGAIRAATHNGPDAAATLLGRVEPFFCHNPQMQSVRSALKQVALSDVPVVLRGETGVGKEVLAREIHALSPRAHRPFLKINCAALPRELLESELFGYERGAFTGAVKSTPGKFEATDGGVILLDEIGDLDIRLQAKLLHVLQDGEFQRVGGRDTIRVNVRVLAATHSDLEKAIQEERFREDLYYRLNVVSIQVPPLRERKDEILAFARLFLEKHAMPGVHVPEITPALADALLAYHWPGNVRELENVIRRLLVFGDADLIAHELLKKVSRPALDRCPPADSGGNPEGQHRVSALDEIAQARKQEEAQVIFNALMTTRWNRRKAARLLNIDYKGLLYKMRKLGIGPSRHAPVPHPQPTLASGGYPSSDDGVPALDEVSQARDQEEARVIVDALVRTDWSRKRAAQLLHSDYRGLLYKMKKLGIGPSQRSSSKPPENAGDGRSCDPHAPKAA